MWTEWQTSWPLYGPGGRLVDALYSPRGTLVHSLYSPGGRLVVDPMYGPSGHTEPFPCMDRTLVHGHTELSHRIVGLTLPVLLGFLILTKQTAAT